jgi:hypothetical protein
MNTRTVLTVASVIAFIFGLGLVLMPAFMGTLYGTGTAPNQLLLGRLFGSTLLGFGVINWLTRDSDYAVVRPILLGNLVGDAVGLLVCLMGTLGGVMNSMGWLSVVIYLVLILGFGYLYFMGQPVNVSQRVETR